MLCVGGYGVGTRELIAQTMAHYKTNGNLTPAEEIWLNAALRAIDTAHSEKGVGVLPPGPERSVLTEQLRKIQLTETGNVIEGATEAHILKYILQKEGIDSRYINLENVASRDTRENFRYNAQLIRNLSGNKDNPIVGVITSPYKLLRAAIVADAEWHRDDIDAAEVSRGFHSARVKVYDMDVSRMPLPEFLSMLIFMVGAPEKYRAQHTSLFKYSEPMLAQKARNNNKYFPDDTETGAKYGISWAELNAREIELRSLLEQHIDQSVQGGVMQYDITVNSFIPLRAEEWTTIPELDNKIMVNKNNGYIRSVGEEPVVKSEFELWVARHGQTRANLLKVLQGNKDVSEISSLTELGQKQAEETAKILFADLEQKIRSGERVIVVTSTLSRSKQTAAPFIKLVEERTGIKLETIPENDANEISFGACNNTPLVPPSDAVKQELIKYGINSDGMSPEDKDISAKWSKGDASAKFRGGESFLDVMIRSKRLLEALNEKYKGKATVVLIGHGAQINAMQVLLRKNLVFGNDDNGDQHIEWLKSELKNSECRKLSDSSAPLDASAKNINIYVDRNKIVLQNMLGDNKPDTFIRVPIEAIESVGIDNIKDFLATFQKAPNGYVELYYMSGMDEVSESVYQKYGLHKKPLPKDFKRTRENTITLFPAFKGEDLSKLDRSDISTRLGSIDISPEDTILSPMGLQNDPAGLIRATIVGLKVMDVARQIKEKGIGITKEQAFKDKVQLEILEQLKNVCDADDLKNFNLNPDDIIALAAGNINNIITALKKLIKLLPITPLNAEELRQIYEHAKAVIVAA
jgi:broad specificity phosphatase PhoE